MDCKPSGESPDPVRPQSCKCLVNYIEKINSEYRVYKSPQPYLNLGFYQGQGFGQLLEHSHRHLALSVLLERPFLMDLHTRDPNYTWRSFFAPSDLVNWVPPSWIQTESYSKLLSEKGDDQLSPNAVIPPELLFFDITTENSSIVDPFMDFREQRDKIIFSPNWGMWWKGVKVQVHLEKKWNCTLEHIMAHRPLFQPTELSYAVFNEAIKSYFPEEMAHRPYGVFHLRFTLVKVHRNFRSKMNATIWAAGLAQCAAQFSHIKQWLLLSDFKHKAMSIAQANTLMGEAGIRNLATYDNASSIIHSNRQEARAALGHAFMADSVSDWMLLRQAEVSVLSAGAYGRTSSQGTGKMLQRKCGVKNEGQDVYHFSVYHRD